MTASRSTTPSSTRSYTSDEAESRTCGSKKLPASSLFYELKRAEAGRAARPSRSRRPSEPSCPIDPPLGHGPPVGAGYRRGLVQHRDTVIPVRHALDAARIARAAGLRPVDLASQVQGESLRVLVQKHRSETALPVRPPAAPERCPPEAILMRREIEHRDDQRSDGTVRVRAPCCPTPRIEPISDE